MSIPGTARGNLIGEKLPHACMLMELIEVTYYINGLQLFYDNERSSKKDKCFLLVEVHLNLSLKVHIDASLLTTLLKPIKDENQLVIFREINRNHGHPLCLLSIYTIYAEC